MGCCCGTAANDENNQPLIGNEKKPAKREAEDDAGHNAKAQNGNTPDDQAKASKPTDKNANVSPKKKEKGGTDELQQSPHQTPEAKKRLQDWEERRKQKLNKNKQTRRLSGEMEHGNWAKIVNEELDN